MGTESAVLEALLRDWLACASGFFIDASVGFADGLSNAPLSESGRRLALRDAAWVLLEKGGEPFVLAGIRDCDWSQHACFTVFEHCVTGDNRVSFWECSAPGEWRFLRDSSFVSFPAS